MRGRVVLLLVASLCACDGAFDLVEVRLPDGPTVDSAPDGLVAHYTFDSIDDGLLLDSIGGNHGTCETGCPQPTPGVRGGALQFDGVNTLIDVASSAALETTTGFTVTAWVKLDDLTAAACFANKLLGVDRNSWQFCTYAGMQFVYTAGASDGYLGPATISQGAWHHVAARYDGMSASFYFDGFLVETEVVSVFFDGSAMVFGGDRDGGQPVVRLIGAMDDLRIYSRSLAVGEIDDLARP
jgi:hypothetical protein